MKKYITIAALLAAGTAFANAETVTFDTLVSGATGTNVSDVSYKYEEGAIVYQFNSGAFTNLKNETVVNALTGSSGVVTVAAWVSPTGTGSYNSIFGWGETGKGFKFTLKPTDSEFDPAFVTKNVKESVATGLNVVSSDWTLVYMSYNVGDTCFRLGTSEKEIGYSDNRTSNPVTVNSFAIGSADGNTSSESYKGLIANLTVITSKDWLNQADIISAMGSAPKTIAAPEPSAFGMLAGLGALALVASRRRRK